MNMGQIVIIGSGNLAEALAYAMAERGVGFTIAARNSARAMQIAEQCRQTTHNKQLISTTSIEQAPAGADLYIITVSDRAIGEVADAIPAVAQSLVVHTSGATSIEALPKRFRRGVIYPLQTFTAGRRVDFAEVPIFIEGCDDSSESTLTEFASRLSHRVSHADSEQRRRLHLAGVFACNFANQMFAIGGDVARSAGFDFEVLVPLIRECAAKAIVSPDPHTIQTGPAVRGDKPSQERHLEMIDDERLSNMYKLISENIWETSKKI